MIDWTVVFVREIRGLPLRRAVDVCADADLPAARLEDLGRSVLPFRERGEYRLLKIRRVELEGKAHQAELFGVEL